MSKGHIVKVLFTILWLTLFSRCQGFCFGLGWGGPVTHSSLGAMEGVPSPLMGSCFPYSGIS